MLPLRQYFSLCVLWSISLTNVHPVYSQERYRVVQGNLHFTSDAPLELIQASSGSLRGIIDPENGKLAFSVSIRSFEGFKSSLQKDHFNENYMESEQYPKASFAGRLVGKTDLRKDSTYTVHVKGELNIHGQAQTRTLQGLLTVERDKMILKCDFTVALSDHGISIPKILYQKITTEVEVQVRATLRKGIP